METALPEPRYLDITHPATTMFTGRKIAAFFGVAAILYAVLMLAWIGVGPAYGVAFRAAGGILLGSCIPNTAVTFHAIASGRAAGDMDVQLTLRSRSAPQIAEVPISSRFLGYLPTALLIALVLATPISFRRRWLALMWGLLFVHVFIWFRVLLFVVAVATGESGLAMNLLGHFGDRAVQWLAELLSISLTGCYLGPIIIWIAVTFRREDWQIVTAHTRHTSPVSR